MILSDNIVILFLSLLCLYISSYISAGTSEEYHGDSQINVIGDLVSCALGYNTARYFNVVYGSSILPLIIFFGMEVYLAMTIRDNMGLMTMQLLFPLGWYVLHKLNAKCLELCYILPITTKE